MMTWSPNSWSNFHVKQIPKFSQEIDPIKKTLSLKDNIVSLDGISCLKNKLSNLEYNNDFIIQMGECAETFAQCTHENINDRVNLINTFANIIEKNSNKNTLKIGRIAGQYSKPRSSIKETIKGETLNVYRGDMLNDFIFSKNNRTINPLKMLEAYSYSKKSVDYIKEVTKDFETNLFSSHECLVLPYEESLTKNIHHKYYNTSTHMLWLGDKTRFLGSAHVEYLRGIQNTIGIKVGVDVKVTELIEIIITLNPLNQKGKIILINRMGVKYTLTKLPAMVEEIKNKNINVLWICDPMHGNTYEAYGYKTRNIDDIIKEIKDFSAILKAKEVYFAGIHLESTPQDVTECLAIKAEYGNLIEEANLGTNYQSYCDPRLNYKQSLYIAKVIRVLLKEHHD